ncbi:hypothetical protein K2173_010746 [Erythroxylum novogranatense]|uniref:Uncharacterized protein n=1 Tax=Erythroxylum novogranatense TaxID=1862640 RepID=A0AAV8SRJ3_9ROSI|nr:hypothetical protein K2173_010746 [Erythroxylum novogranatense]
MEVEVVKGEIPILFPEEEKLKEMEGFKRGDDYVEMSCGCTSRKYGDAHGTLRVYHSTGQFLITCDCTPGCQGQKFNPYEFEKHSEKEGTSDWPRHIWVLKNGKKIPIWRTTLLKYYKHSANGASGSKRRIFHRDEFISCSNCNKQRRFRLRTKDDCRTYHDALANKNWKCDDHPYDEISCKDEEERGSRKSSRGCPRRPNCSGCTSCVCFGCLICRFVDCGCRGCTDFMQNAPP